MKVKPFQTSKSLYKKAQSKQNLNVHKNKTIKKRQTCEINNKINKNCMYVI